MVRWFGSSDSYWKTYFLNKHRFSDVDTSRAIRFDSLLGWRLKSSFSGLVDGLPYNTDGSGRRISPFEPKPAPAAVVLFIGDSFTEGSEVSDSNAFPSRLQELRPDLKVVNAGVPGYSHSQMLLLLKEELRNCKPDFVVLGFDRDDVGRNQLTFNGFSKPGHTIMNEQLKLMNANVDPPEEILRTSGSISSAFLFFRFLVSEKKEFSVQSDTEVAKLLIHEMKRACDSSSADFLVAMIATPDEIKDGSFEHRNKPFIHYFQEDSIPIVLLHRDLAAEHGIKGDRRPGGHWGEQGNRIIARVVGNCFKSDTASQIRLDTSR